MPHSTPEKAAVAHRVVAVVAAAVPSKITLSSLYTTYLNCWLKYVVPPFGRETSSFDSSTTQAFSGASYSHLKPLRPALVKPKRG